jgi:hypothetical protein
MLAASGANDVPHWGAAPERAQVLGVTKKWALFSFTLSSRGNNIV